MRKELLIGICLGLVLTLFLSIFIFIKEKPEPKSEDISKFGVRAGIKITNDYNSGKYSQATFNDWIDLRKEIRASWSSFEIEWNGKTKGELEKVLSEKFDYIINTEVGNDFSLVIRLVAGGNRNDCLEAVTNPEGYKEFIRTVVNRYKDKVKYWAIENEQNALNLFECYDCADSGFEYKKGNWRNCNDISWDGRADYLDKFLKPAYDEIKSICPDCKVVLGGPVGKLGEEVDIGGPIPKNPKKSTSYFTQKYLIEGKEYYDVIDMHEYGIHKKVEENMDALNNIMNENNIDVPVFYTEIGEGSGLECDSEKMVCNEETQANNLVKRFTIAFGKGAYMISWTHFITKLTKAGDPKNRQLVDFDGISRFTKRPVFYSYKLMTEKLNGFETAEDLSESNYKLFRFNFNDGREVYVAWCKEKSEFDTTECARITIADLNSFIPGNVKTTYLNSKTSEVKTKNYDSGSVSLGVVPVFVEAVVAPVSIVSMAFGVRGMENFYKCFNNEICEGCINEYLNLRKGFGAGFNTISIKWGGQKIQKLIDKWTSLINKEVNEGFTLVVRLRAGQDKENCPLIFKNWDDFKKGNEPLGEVTAKYRSFVRKIVDEFKDKVQYWEIENEQNAEHLFKCHKDKYEEYSGEAYVKMLKAAYEEIKSVCSDCTVIMGGLVGETGKTDTSNIRAIRAKNFLIKGDGYYDMVDVHMQKTYVQLENKIRYLGEELMAKNGIDVPIIIPATGEGSGPECEPNVAFCNAKTQADNLPKRFIPNFALGVSRISWIHWLPNKPFELYCKGDRGEEEDTHRELVDFKYNQNKKTGKFTLKPVYESYKLMTEKISGFSSIDDLSFGAYRLFRVNFPKKDSVYVAWCVERMPDVDGEYRFECVESGTAIDLSLYLSGNVVISYLDVQGDSYERKFEIRSSDLIDIDETLRYIE